MPAISDTRNYFNGKADTQKVLAWNTSCGATDINTYAAPYCNSYIFPDGVTRGFLMSSGELWFLYNNKQQIEACLTACGGDAFDTTRYTVTSTFTGMWSGSFPCFDEMNWGNGGWYSTNHADTWSNCSTRPIGEYTLQK